jgi:peptidoglycan-N-acetylglucosamine deacetylase
LDGQLRGIVCVNKQMITVKNIAHWASVGILLSIAGAMVYVKFLPAPSQPSPLRLAFFDGTSPEARVALERHIGDLDGVIGEWLKVDSSGNVSEEEDPEQDDANPSATVGFIRSTRPLTMFALVSDEPSRDRGFAHLGDPGFRQHLEQQLLSSVQKFQFDGLIINFDEFRWADESGLRELISELRASLAPSNKKVGVLLPGEGRIEYGKLGSLADLVVVQLYDDGDNDPGPISRGSWWRRVLADRSNEIPADKLVFAYASMGRDWTRLADDGVSDFMSFGAIMRAAAMQHATIQFDAESLNPHFSYYESSGAAHDIWFLDAATAFNQIKAMVAARPHGIALWELGSEDESLWSIFRAHFDGTTLDVHAIEYLHCDYIAMRTGTGEIYQFKNVGENGHRNVQVGETGEIVYESYETLPRPWELQVEGVLPGTVVLAFDDGPHPQYTDEILDILKREGVKATFFVTGAQSSKYPSIVQRIANEGHEIGNHTFSHPDLTKLSDSLVRLEITSTQRVIQVLTGKPPVLVRPPYAADDMGYTIPEAHVIEIANSLGYKAVGANLNPEDWRGISAETIVETVLRKVDAGDGSIIELHDAGGDRSQTVKALPLLIQALRSRGLRFALASELAGAVAAPTMRGADDPWLPIASVAFGGMFLGSKLFLCLFWSCLVLSGLRFCLLLVAALGEHRASKAAAIYEPQVSALIPAYNEEKVIVRTVELVLRSSYEHLAEIIVVDDGSTDGTSSVIREAFAKEPRVRLFRTPNRGKAAALNHAVANMQTEIAVTVDADTCLDRRAIPLLVRHFGNPKIAAVAGNAKVGNRKNLLTKLQALEYITSQNLERAGLAKFNAIAVVPGAVGAWRREAVLKAGGFNTTTLAEDCDLTFSLLRIGYRVAHDMEAIGWTEAPETWRAFMRQRFRWTFGTLQATYRHSDAMFSKRWDGFTRVTLPSVILFNVILPLIGPILDVLFLVAIFSGIVGLLMHPEAYHVQARTWIVMSYIFVFLIELLAAILAFALEPYEQKRLIWYLPIQRICYRQAMYVIMIQALLAGLRGSAQGWRKLARIGSVKLPGKNMAKTSL